MIPLAGRSSPGGPVDDIVLSSGHWPTTTGQIVVFARQSGLGLGQVITLTGVPHDPKPTIVGVGTSATGTVGGWVLPAEMTALRIPLAAAAGLGVLNAVVLMTRERAHDVGVLKAVGMTPRQTITMLVTTVAVTGLVAGLIAVPAGTALHHAIVPIMASGAKIGLPSAAYDVYNPSELLLLTLAGLVIGIVGALAAAGWAAASSTAVALRAE